MEERETRSQPPLRLHVGRHAAIWLILKENSSGERFDDKEDLDRFKIPISGFLARWTVVSPRPCPRPLPLPVDILGCGVDEAGKRCWHIALKGVKQRFSNLSVNAPASLSLLLFPSTFLEIYRGA